MCLKNPMQGLSKAELWLIVHVSINAWPILLSGRRVLAETRTAEYGVPPYPSISKSGLNDYPMRERERESKDYARLDMPLAIPAQILALLCATLGLSILGLTNHQQVGQFNTMKSDTLCMVEMVASCFTKLQLDFACFQVTVLRIDKLLRFACGHMWAHRETLANKHPGAKSLSLLR